MYSLNFTFKGLRIHHLFNRRAHNTVERNGLILISETFKQLEEATLVLHPGGRLKLD